MLEFKTHTKPRSSSLKNIKPNLFSNRKEKTDKNNNYIKVGVTLGVNWIARGVRASSKRTAGNTGFNERGGSKPRSKKKKVLCID